MKWPWNRRNRIRVGLGNPYLMRKDPDWYMVSTKPDLFHIGPGDVFSISSDNGPQGPVCAEVKFEEKMDGQFAFDLLTRANGDHRLRITFPDSSQKMYRPPTEGQWWVEVV